MRDRITEIEIQLTHQQHLVEELNSLMYSQQQEIDSLTAELRQIKAQLQIVLPSLVKDTDEEEPPPHY